MELLQNLVSAPQTATEQEVDDSITTLVDRLVHSTLVSDRRSAVLAIKSYSRNYREIVIAKGLKQLLATLHADNSDLDIVKAILETLIILFIRGEGNKDLTRDWINNQSRVQNGKYPSPSILIQNIKPDQFSLWIADELTQNLSNLELLIEVLEFDDIHTRIYALQLLQALVSTRNKRTQELILKSPTAISLLCQVLDDDYEPIRNEAILLLMGIVRDNFNIQKLVVFENTFDKLYSIIEQEGGIQGTIIVQDCLSLISNLLKFNSSNQKYFIETNCLSKLVNLIDQCLNVSTFTWNIQRLDNLLTTLETCRLFVIKDTQDIEKSQNAFVDSGIMLSCLKLVFSLNIPNEVRVTSLLTVSDIIRGNNDVQFKFSQVDVPYLDPSLPPAAQKFEEIVPITVALLNWCLYVNSVHTFDIRAASSYTLHAFFKDNNEAKLAFIEDQEYTFNVLNGVLNPSDLEDVSETTDAKLTTIEKLDNIVNKPDEIHNNELTKHLSEASDNLNERMNSSDTNPSSVEINSLESKANIFQTLIHLEDFKLNPYKIWFSSVVLLYIFEDFPESKSIITKIMIRSDDVEEEEEEQISILSGIAQALCSSLRKSDIRVPISYLMLLSNWCFENYAAVDQFLKDSSILDQLLAFIVDPETNNELVQGLVSFFLSVVYEFSRKVSPVPRLQLFQYLSKRIGAHAFSLKVQQFIKDPHVVEFKEFDWLDSARDDSGLPEVYFEELFICQVRDNSQRMIRAIGRDPNIEPIKKLDYSAYEELEAKLSQLSSEYLNFKKDATETSQNQTKQIESNTKEFEELSHKYRTILADMEKLEDEKDKLLNNLTTSAAEVKKYTELQKILETKSSELDKKLSGSLAKLKNVEANNKQLQEKLKVTEESKATAESGINKMSRELMNLTREKAASEKRVTSLEKELNSIKQKNEALESSLQKLNDSTNVKIKELEVSLNEKSSELEKLLKTHASLVSTVEEKDQKIKNLSETQSDLISKLKSAAEIIENLKSQKNSSINELSEYKESISAEIKLLKSSLNEINEEKSKLVQEKDELSAKHKSMKEELKKAHDDFSTLQDELTSVYDDFNTLQDESSKDIESLNAEIKTLKGRFEELEEENKILKTENSNLELQVQSLKTQLASAVSKYESESAELKTELSTQLDKFTVELNDKSSEIEKFVLKFEELNRTVSEKDTLISELIESKSVLKEETERLEQRKDELERSVAESSSLSSKTVEDLRKQLEESKLDLEDKAEKLSLLNEKLSVAESEKEAQKSALEKSLKDANTELNNLRTVKESLEAEIVSLKDNRETSLSKAQSEVKNLNDLIKNLNEAKLSSEAVFEKELCDRKNKILELEKEIESTKSSLNALQKEHKLYESKYDSLKNENSNVIQDLRNEISFLTKTNKEMNEKRDSTAIGFEKVKSDKQKEVENLKDKVTAIQKILDAKNIDYSTLKEEYESFKKEKLTEIQELNATVSKMKDSMHSNENEAKEKEELVKKVTSEKKQAVEKLEDQIKMLKVALTSSETKINDLKLQFESLAKEKDDEVSKINLELIAGNKLRNDLEKEKESIHDEMKLMKEKHNTEITGLKNQNDQFASQLSILTAQKDLTIKDLDKKVLELKNSIDLSEKYKLENEDAKKKIQSQSDSIIKLKESSAKYVSDSEKEKNLLQEKNEKVKTELETEIVSLKSDLEKAISSKNSEIADLKKHNSNETKELADLQKENKDLQEKFKKMEDELKSKLDEALMLWAETSEKKEKYKQMLLDNGQELDDSDEEDSEAEDSEEDDL